ncbi:translocase [Marivita sp. S2033]|uniref:translocase n=1 Tax=Marivita sp. S2033 TaxID=3373187 RepID=UPI0039827D59
MIRKASVLIAAGTVVAALGIGAAMQYLPSSGTPARSVQKQLVMSDVQEVSSTPKAPVPLDVPVTVALPTSLVSNTAALGTAPRIDLPKAPVESGFSCDIDLTATATAGAMLSVTLRAPCHGSERVTLHHSGLMFTDVMQPDGSLSVDIPALSERALVIASFLDGTGAVAHAEVSTIPFYDRVVLQWRGDAGLQLHAREFDAQYFSDGHIWQGANFDASRAATGDGGFLTRLGQPDAPDALLAEVYTFPTGVTESSGTVTLTVEAAIQASNCNTVVEAQTLELRQEHDLKSRELTIDVPGCDTVGDFLMLKNVVENLTIAAR